MEDSIQDNRAEERSLSDQILETILKFNEKRFQLEQDSKFLEAGRIKAKLAQLGDEYVKVRLEDLQNRQENEKKQFDANYEQELEEVQQTWDKKLEEKEKAIQEQLAQMQQLHASNIEKAQKQLKESQSLGYKPTPEILNLGYQIRLLVNDQRYTEAATLQKKLDVLKSKSEEKFGAKSDEKARNLLDKVVRDQMLELNALESKLASERDAIIKAREKGLNATHSKYKVIHDKLLKQHHQEEINEKKQLKNFNASSNQLLPPTVAQKEGN